MRRFAHSKSNSSRFSPKLVFSAIVCSVLAACGGGGGGAGTDDPNLGAALPAGDHIALSQTQMTLAEADRSGVIDVYRTGNGSGSVSVGYRFVAGSALSTSDFIASDGVLTWSDADTSVRRVSFVVNSDLLSESAESFRFELFDVTGTETLADANAMAITINDSVCNAVVPAAVASDTSLSAPCYRMSTDVNVSANAQLSVSAGTTIIANPGTQLSVSGSASLRAVGNVTAPISFVGADRSAGSWRGVRLLSTSALHQFEHVTISEADTALDVIAGGSLASFSHSAIANTVTAAMSLPLASVEQLGAGNSYPGNNGAIRVLPRTIQEGESISVPMQDTHYVLNGIMGIAGELQFQPGVELHMVKDAFLLVTGAGSINAVGTEFAPILIRGEQEIPGYWDGIQFVSSGSTLNQLAYVTVSHGGGDPARPGNIVFDGSGNAVSRP